MDLEREYDDLDDEITAIILGDEEDEEIGDFSLARTITLPPVDHEVIQRKLDSIGSTSPHARSLIQDIELMRQTMGDADAMIADLATDIENEVRTLFLEFRNSPGTILLGILGSLPADQQLQQIETIIELLTQRKNRLERQAIS